MAAKRKKQQACPRLAGWMTTFTDMTTLLLTFFILMFTTAEIDGHELKLILSSFAGSFGVMEGGLTLQPGPLAQMGMTVEALPSQKAAQQLSKALKDFESQFKQQIRTRKVKFQTDIRGYVISIPAQNYFEPGSAQLTPDGRKLLEKVGILLKNIKKDTGKDNQIEIEGHTSKEPNTEIWERNLRLSTERAIAVEKFFIVESKINTTIEKEGKKTIAKFVAKGFGQFEPNNDNDSDLTRADNRRVDIVIKR